MANLRLDLLLVQRALAPTREQARQLIRAGRVRSGGRILDKPGQATPDDIALEVKPSARFVSRGGVKLLGAIEGFQLRVAGRVGLDAGISTGGFSDCLLQHGCRRIYGVDVGYGQLAWNLRNDQRVVLKERCNLRYLTPLELYGADGEWADLAVADLSFISLKLVLPTIHKLLKPPREAVVLVKPQFEVGRERVGKGGVVRDTAAHCDAVSGVLAAARELGWHGKGICASPITGPAGNHEYWLHLIDSVTPAPHTLAPGPVEASAGAVRTADQHQLDDADIRDVVRGALLASAGQAADTSTS